jgi:glutathione peroxidase-family protein
MIVNTASKWFNTSIQRLEAIYISYKDDNFVVVGFQQIILGTRAWNHNEIATFVNLLW